MQNRKLNQHGYTHGYTMVELAISISIIAMGLAAFLPAITQITASKKQETTIRRMETVLNHLSTYVTNFNDLPCPAAPDGAVFGEPIADCVATPDSGVVPFRALGLREIDIMDGWGNYFTYRISPVFKQMPLWPAAPVDAGTHLRCRTDDTNPATPNWVVAGLNVNPHKARFCCQSTMAGDDDIGTDIQIMTDLDADGTFTNWIERPREDMVTAPANFSDTGVGSNTWPSDFTAVAVVLVSHGANAHGAMIKGQPVGSRYQRTDAVGTAETENANADNVFQIIETSKTSGNSHFDDIVMFRTNDTLYAETTGRSCGVP